jgi:endonuclease/exonuclease/phosphatase family metal-dependent hydrolase
MPLNLRRITKKLLLLGNILLAVFFLVAILAAYVNPVKYWYIAFLGLAFPYLLFLVVVYLILWLVFRSKWTLLNIALLLVGLQSIQSVFAFHLFTKKFKQEKKENAIRVMQWNCMSFGEYVKDRVSGTEIREQMLNYIRENNADVLCLQEFFYAYDTEFNDNLKYVQDKLGYPNCFFSKDYVRYKRNTKGVAEKIGYWGTIIFSKLKIEDSGRVVLTTPEEGNPESLIYLDVLSNKDTVRIMSAHLQSLRFGKTDYENIDNIKKGDEEALLKTKGTLAKIKKGYTNRKKQAEIVKEEIEKSRYPVIIAGDFNDVPNSYTYSTIKGNLQDAFLKKGFGIGRTFAAISPTLRIDYIFADKKFNILQLKKENKNLSDHYPIIADMEVKH